MTKTLKFIISSNFIFELSGSFLEFLNMTEVVEVNNQYEINSKTFVDIFQKHSKSTYYFYRHEDGKCNNEQQYTLYGKSCFKKTVWCSFGQYIIFENIAKKINEIYDKILDSI